MPEAVARILRFPTRWTVPLSPEEVRESARSILNQVSDKPSPEEADQFLADPDVISALCKLLRDVIHSDPAFVAKKASSIYALLNGKKNGECGLFDECDYFLGDTALLVAISKRVLGNREEAEIWLQRAEAGFRHTVNPGPLLAQVAYHRLALQFDKRRFSEVLELLPSTLKSFEKFGMRTEAARTRFLEALTLKGSSRDLEALEKFANLSTMLNDREDAGLLGQVVVEIGAYRALDGRYDEAIDCYQRALSLLTKADLPNAVAHLRLTVGETLRLQGNLSPAVEAFREGIRGYAELGMKTYVAYAQVMLAETLLALGRNREAEWEILSALPTIEEQKMVPEGFAAVAILRESASRRQADPNALRELREHLKAKG